MFSNIYKKYLSIIFFLTLLLVPNYLFAFEKSSIIDLSKTSWEYRWGDSPFEDDVPLWIKESSSNQWKNIPFPSNPPNRNEQTNVWYKTQLPNTLSQNPSLYIFSIDLIAEVYLNGKKLYNFGSFDKNGYGVFEGWPWHLIALPQNAAGKDIYFRVYSDYPDIGLWGEVLLAPKADILERMLKNDLPMLGVGAISFFVGILFIFGYFTRFNQIEIVIIGLLFFTQSMDLILSSKVIQLYFNYPLANQMALAFSYFFFPFGVALFIEQIIGSGIFKVIRYIWQMHLIFLIFSIFVVIFNILNLSTLYFYFDYIYYYVTLPILTLSTIHAAIKGNNEVRIVTVAFLIEAIYWLYSSLISWNIIPWAEKPHYIAAFLCLLLFGYIILKRLVNAYELEKMNIELKNAQIKLKKLANTDYLTGLYNRKYQDKAFRKEFKRTKRYGHTLGVILIDIDDFKKINDNFGHQIGDKVLQDISNILKKYTREHDIVGRWGGEEFLIICPQTDMKGTKALAENLRKKIENFKFLNKMSQTASFGLSINTKTDDMYTLISRTDKALYMAKDANKNCVVAL